MHKPDPSSFLYQKKKKKMHVLGLHSEKREARVVMWHELASFPEITTELPGSQKRWLVLFWIVYCFKVCDMLLCTLSCVLLFYTRWSSYQRWMKEWIEADKTPLFSFFKVFWAADMSMYPAEVSNTNPTSSVIQN